MILRSEILEIGRTLKPHGVKGEITAELYGSLDLSSLKCLVADIDGIYVPFFLESWRTKTTDTVLLKFDGLNSDEDVAILSTKPLYALKTDVEESEDGEESGLYASDLIGFKAVTADDEPLGMISDVNDDTENTLFIIDSVDGAPLLVPAADEFIADIDIDNKIVKLDLPEGLIDL